MSAQLSDERRPDKRCTVIELTCAVTPGLSRDVALISDADYEALIDARNEFIPDVTFLGGTGIITGDNLSIGCNSVKRETVVVSSAEQLALSDGLKINV